MDILLSQITAVASLDECEPLKATRYWHTDVRLISNQMLRALHTELELQFGQVAADNCMKALLEQCFNDFLTGKFYSEHFLNYQLPIRSSDITSAVDSLNSFKGVERSAVLFGLIEAPISLAEIVRLTWGEVDYKSLKQASAALLRSTPIHLNTPFVFWRQESDSQCPIPLFDFIGRFMEVTDMSWPRFVQCISIAGVDFTNTDIGNVSDKLEYL